MRYMKILIVLTLFITFTGCQSESFELPDINIPTNTILYITSDHRAIELGDKKNVFNVSIVSNSYDRLNKFGTITFSGTLTSIGDNAFRDCQTLWSVVIPKSVTSIGSYAFYITYLSNVTCEAVKPPILGSNVFTKIELYVPKGSFSAYSASDWREYYRNIDDYWY